MIFAGEFNESVRSENTINFVNETGSCDMFAEANGVDLEKMIATCQHDRVRILRASYRRSIK